MDRLFGTFSLAILFFAVRVSMASDSYLLKSASMEEFIDSKEQISGSSTVGAFYVADNDRVQIDKLYGYINEPISGNLVG